MPSKCDDIWFELLRRLVVIIAAEIIRILSPPKDKNALSLIETNLVRNPKGGFS